MEEKKQLRAAMQQRRDAIDLAWKRQYDQHVCARLKERVLQRDAKTVHVYLPMGMEINIFPFISWLLETNRTVVAPKVLPERQLENLQLESLTGIEKGVFGTSHPSSGKRVEEGYDLVVVPGLAFDIRNYRLGYGGGYYDRFLKKHPDVYTIGIHYPFQLHKEIPIESHDIRLNERVCLFEY